MYLYSGKLFRQTESVLFQDTDKIHSEIDDSKVYDLFICMDCGDKERLGFSTPLFESAKMTACIDHHVSNEAFADYNEIIPDASSTSELVYRLIDKDKISLHCAEALYMGIAHDTGVFQYSCTGRRTMEIAGKLMEKGFDFNELLDQIDDVKEELNPDLENVRCFVTKYQKFNQAHLQGAEIIEEQYPIMRTKIRFSGVVARSTFVRMPVALHSPRSAAAEDYETLVNEYLDMIGDEDDGEI